LRLTIQNWRVSEIRVLLAVSIALVGSRKSWSVAGAVIMMGEENYSLSIATLRCFIHITLTMSSDFRLILLVSLFFIANSMAVVPGILVLIRLKSLVATHIPVTLILRPTVNVVLVLIRRGVPVVLSVALVTPWISTLVELAARITLRLGAIISLIVVRVTLLILVLFVISVGTSSVLLRRFFPV
jgi:hypothetical protein